MGEGRLHLYILILILLGVLVLVLAYAVRYMDFFNIDSILVQGMDTVPQSVMDLLTPCYGVNRFVLDEGELEAEIEANALIDSCSVSYSFPARLEVRLVRSAETCMLYDGTSYYLMDRGVPVLLSGKDSASYADTLCVLEVSGEFISYMEKFEAPQSFSRILDLVGTVNQAGIWLITRIKYDNNTGDGFGQIVLSLDSLNSELYVRQDVSAQRIIDSIRVIQASIENDPASTLAMGTWRWDLYGDALVRRTVGD